MKNFLKNWKSAAVVVGISVSLLSCSKSTSSQTASDSSGASAAFPSGLAVASLTASTPASSLMLQLGRSELGAKGGGSSFTPKLSYTDKVAYINSIINGKSLEDCKISLPSLNSSGSPSCYGPNLYYINHPNDVRTISENSSSRANSSLPGGDLGIWTSAESSGEACVSAKMNQLIGDLSAKGDTALLLAASMVCIMNVNGKSLPAAGDSPVDLTVELNTAASASSSSTVVTEASLSRLPDQDSHPVYKIAISATQSASSLKINLKHMPTNSDNTLYQGKLWATLTGLTSTDERQKNAYVTLGYEKTATDMRMELEFAGTKASVTDAMSSDGAIDWGKVQESSGANSANLQHAVFQINPSTGVGSASYSWQAGGGDSNSRVFNVFIKADADSIGGCGFLDLGVRILFHLLRIIRLANSFVIGLDLEIVTTY